MLAKMMPETDAPDFNTLLATPINIVDGTTLVITGEVEQETLKELGRLLGIKGLKDVMIIRLEPGQAIETLNEADMERFGWVRKTI